MINEKNNEAGFSLIELVVVIVILGIITSVLVPQFLLMKERSQIAVDVESVKNLQEQIDAYCIEKKSWPGSTVEEMVSTLVSDKYLTIRYLNVASSMLDLKTHGAEVIFDETASQIKLKVTPHQYEIYSDEQNKSQWMVSS